MKVVRLTLTALACTAMVGMLLIRSGPDPDAVPTADDVAGRMMSPFCEGLTLEECPTDRSTRLRDQIAQMAAGGATNRQIDRWMEDNYGVVSLGRPRTALAWIAPPLAGAAGLAIVMFILRSRKMTPPADTPPELTDADEDRFNNDFNRFVRGTE